jgi:hypothetical protein
MEYEGLESINLAQGTSENYMIKCVARLLSNITTVCQPSI